VDAIGTDVDAVLVDTDALEMRITSARAENLDDLDATVSSRATQVSVDVIDADVGSILADTTELTDVRLTAGRASNLDNLDAAISSIPPAPPVVDIVDGVWDESLSGHVSVGSTGKALADAGAGGDPAAIADAVWDEVQGDHVAPGSTGYSLNNAGSGGSISDVQNAVISGKGSVISSLAQNRLIDTARTESPDDFWRNHHLGFTTGSNKGKFQKIISWNATTKEFVFESAFPNVILPGHLYVIVTATSSAEVLDQDTVTVPTGGVATFDKTPVRF